MSPGSLRRHKAGWCLWLLCHALGSGCSVACAPSLQILACTGSLTACLSVGARRLSRKLLQVSILTIDTQDRFNTYNDFASLDFDVQFNVRPLQQSSVDEYSIVPKMPAACLGIACSRLQCSVVLALRVVCGSDQATRDTRLPPSILPLSLPLNLVQAVLRARGIIVSPGSLLPAVFVALCCRQMVSITSW